MTASDTPARTQLNLASRGHPHMTWAGHRDRDFRSRCRKEMHAKHADDAVRFKDHGAVFDHQRGLPK